MVVKNFSKRKKEQMLNGCLVFLSFLVVVSCRNAESDKDLRENPIFIGTYTKKEGHVDGQADGIIQLYQNPETGKLKEAVTVAEVVNPSFLTVSFDNKNLYAVSELGKNDAESGLVYSYKINEDHSLTFINKLPTGGFAPCHISMDRTDKFAFVSNYTGGVIMLYERKQEGSLEKKQQVELENPEAAHAHSVNISADNKHAYVADLGNNRIWIYDFNSEEGKLTANEQRYLALEEGAGPRHFTFSQNGKHAWTINELNSSISILRVLENGGLELLGSVASLPPQYDGKNSAADIHLHPSGNFLYSSNRGHNSIASFEVNKETGGLTNIAYTEVGGKTPRNFAIAPQGDFLYVANQDSNNITIFKIDPESGKPELQDSFSEVKTPVCLQFLN